MVLTVTHHLRLLGRLMLAGVACMLLACPGRIEDPDVLFGAGDCSVFTPRFIANRCATSGCHSAVDMEGELDLESADIVQRLLDQPSSDTACGGLLIDSADPTASLMLTKLENPPPCGDRMPLLDRAPTAFETTCMLEWLQEALANP